MKTILITGASSGIGLETVRYFAEKGWNVAATMRTPSKVTALDGLANVRKYALDVTNQDSIATAVA